MPKDQHQLRRPPKQDRSRERVDEILGAAKKLIGEKGVDAVKMREIAALTGGPISSIYQYFPNKSAIILTLFERWSSELTSNLAENVETITCYDDLERVACGLFDYYYARILADPAIVDLLHAVQADKTLKNADIAESNVQAKLFFEKARSFLHPRHHDAFLRASFLILQLAVGAVRLALSVPPEQKDQILQDFKAIISGQLRLFATAE